MKRQKKFRTVIEQNCHGLPLLVRRQLGRSNASIIAVQCSPALNPTFSFTASSVLITMFQHCSRILFPPLSSAKLSLVVLCLGKCCLNGKTVVRFILLSVHFFVHGYCNKNLCQMQPSDPIPTPLAWPVVSVMPATPAHPSAQGDSHQGVLRNGWREETCDWSFPVIAVPQQHSWQDFCFCGKVCVYVLACRSVSPFACVYECQEPYLHTNAFLCVHVRHRKCGCKY